ncbi:rhodanese-like domain-containing protein [Corynebacterium sp. TAE3-ERU12]|uniref:rhodanese-like domain-containing protein n=1 Tax=Corynebacterium sp. TAE3-ERU12 TaxID=2849491 RepID=UPI001C4677C0|nr:rhodanese-like domain-containing protein [Corynebacterium sp. TAE3-ERU12]MBV7295938.1 rhodanese-like domain-containing protein [Corynebacterium sp. TAE3-ERU12]
METIPVKDVPDNCQLIDVRSEQEFADGHPAGAINIPMEQIPARYGELDLDEDIYLICRSGGRSGQVGQWLERNGIDAYSVTGGFIDWEYHNRPIEKA